MVFLLASSMVMDPVSFADVFLLDVSSGFVVLQRLISLERVRAYVRTDFGYFLPRSVLTWLLLLLCLIGLLLSIPS